MNNLLPLAAIYCRVSSRDQGAADKSSLSDQLKACRARAEADGYAVPDILVFEDQLSGTLDETERPAFGRLMNGARNGDFRRVYFWRVDRLGRDQAVIAGALRDLVRAGVDYVSVSEPDLANPLLRAVLAGVAEHERQTILARTRKGIEARRANQQWVAGMVPFGHRRGPGLTLEQCPDEAPIVRRIFDLSERGEGRIRIARQFNTENVPPPIAEIRMPGNDRVVRLRINAFGGMPGLLAYMEKIEATWWRAEPKWNESIVNRIIENTIYYGESGGRPYSVSPCPIISKAQFAAVNAAKAARKNKGANPRDNKLLSGLAVCGCCGRRYYAHQGGTPKTPRHYLFCRGRRTGTCSNPVVRLDAASSEVIERVTLYLTDNLKQQNFYDFMMRHGRRKMDEAQARLGKAQAELSAAETERRQLLDTLVDLRRLGLAERDMEDLAAKVKALTPTIEDRRREVEELISDLGRMKANVAVDDEEARAAARMAEDALWIEPTVDSFGRLAMGEPRDLLQIIVRKITVKTDGGLDIELNDSEDALAAVVRYLSDIALKALRSLDAVENLWREDQSNVVDLDTERFMRRVVKA